MESEDLKIYAKKRVKLILKSGYNYNGFVLSVGEDSIRIKDRFGKIVIISLDQISLVEGGDSEDV